MRKGKELAASFLIVVGLANGGYAVHGHFFHPELLMPDRRQELASPESSANELNRMSRMTIAISAEDNVKHPDEACAAAVSAARTWNDCLAERAFGMPSTSEPDVRLILVRRVDCEGQQIAGQASWVYSPSGQLQGTIHVGTTGPNGRNLSEAQIKNASLHEMGHVLGLEDNDRPSHVMGPLNLQHPLTSPASDEVLAVTDFRREIRALAPPVSLDR